MAFLIILSAGVLLLLFLKTFVGDEKFALARRLENQGKFREACYFYAVAVFNGTVSGRQARKAISRLWQAHGPFDYADIDSEACRISSQGHSETLKIIRQAACK